MKQKYFWQGEPVKTEFGYAVIERTYIKPLMWFNYEVEINPYSNSYAIIDAVKITTKDGHSFVIANHFGIGANKLSKGGWPNQTHHGFPKNIFFEPESKQFHTKGIKQFNEDEYSNHESKRRIWQQKTYPEEFKKMKALQAVVINSKAKRNEST